MTSTKLNIPVRIALSLVTGISISIAMALQFFNYTEYSPLDRTFLLSVPAVSIMICAYYLLPYLGQTFTQAPLFEKAVIFVCAFSPVVLITSSMHGASPLLLLAAGVSLFIAFASIVIPSAPYIQKIMDAGLSFRLLSGWLFSTVVVFLALGFLDNFYTSPFEIVCLILFSQLFMGQAGYFLLGRIKRFAQKRFSDFVITLFLFLLLLIFAASIYAMGRQFPKLLSLEMFQLNPELFAVFWAVCMISLPWQAWVLHTLRSTQLSAQLKETKLYFFVNENIAGILLALVFFGIYLLIASMLNNPRFDVDDVFFDADIFNWRLRFTTDRWQDYYWRSVHPFVLLLLKPPIDLAGMLLKGDKLFGAYIVVAFGGALCVFLTWRIVERVTHSSMYALLVAAILGLSTSHLIFGSLIETYIFLAASLLLFYLFLVEEKPFPFLVMAGLASIGITYANFAQNVIAFFVSKPNIKLIFRYVASVVILLVLLSLANNLIYPDAHPFFFVPSALLAEEQNIFPFNLLRVQALVRAFLFHNIVAPTPILHTGEIPFTQFRFFKPEINEISLYDSLLQTTVSWFWLGLILLGVTTFAFNFKNYKSNKLTLALLVCMLFNVGLHLRYGKELFLYSANWTYALVLLLAFAWQRLAKYKWFQIVLLIFLSFVMLNNRLLLNTIFGVLDTYLP